MLLFGAEEGAVGDVFDVSYAAPSPVAFALGPPLLLLVISVSVVRRAMLLKAAAAVWWSR